MGKPVIATDVNGARELMLDGSTGLIVPPKDPEALARTIASIIDDPIQLESFGRVGKKRVAEHFTMQRMADRLEEHLKQKLAEKNRRG